MFASRPICLLLGVLALAVLFIAQGSSGAVRAGALYDRVVDPNSVDCTSSTSVTVHDTIEEALAAAVPNDTIFVCPGTYFEPPLTISDAGVTVEGAGTGAVTVRPSTMSAGFVFQITASGVSLQNMTIDSAPTTGTASSYNVYVLDANNATVSGNVLANAKTIAVRISHTITPPTGITISNNDIEADGSAIGNAIDCICSSSSFTDNTVHTSIPIGIEAVTLDGDNLMVSGNTFDGVAVSTQGDNTTLSNNSFSGVQPSHANFFQLRVHGTGAVVTENSFTDSGTTNGGALNVHATTTEPTTALITKNTFHGPAVTGIEISENLIDDPYPATVTINGGSPADANIFPDPQNHIFLVRLSFSAQNVDAENNNWGLCTAEEIEAKIMDGVDNPTLGTVDYEPFIAANCPTPSPTPSPSPTPTASAPPTPTPTVTPTPTSTTSPTASPTPTPAGQTPTPTPTGTSPTPTSIPPSITPTPTPGELTWGDHNCSGDADPVDALLTLRHDAGLSTETGECPGFGTTLPAGGPALIWGDVDCNGTIDPVDALKLLRFDAGLSVQQEPGCPGIGQAAA